MRVGVTHHTLCARRRSDATARKLSLPFMWAMEELATCRWPEPAAWHLALLPPPHGVTLVDVPAAGVFRGIPRMATAQEAFYTPFTTRIVSLLALLVPFIGFLIYTR